MNPHLDATLTINITFCVLILSSQIIMAQGIIPSPPIIQPGAPGEPSKKLDAKAATDFFTNDLNN